MPLVQYCKKCKMDVPPGETCLHCGGKLTKTSEKLTFGIAHVPVKDWFCWNELLRIALPLLLGVVAVSLLFEMATGGKAAVERLLRSGFPGAMLILLGVILLVFYIILRLQGGERIQYELDKQGIHVRYYLHEAAPVQLYTRLVTKDELEMLAQDEHVLPGLTLIRYRCIQWKDIKRVHFWRENAVMLVYDPEWWQALFVNCPIGELEAVEKMVRKMLKPKKEIREIKIDG